MLAREEWTRGPGTPVVTGLVWFADGSRMKKGTRAGVYGQSVGRRVIISLGRDVTVFEAEIYAVLATAYEIQPNGRSEKYVSTCSDSGSESPSGRQNNVSTDVTLPKGTE
jgi:hypothetical protein